MGRMPHGRVIVIGASAGGIGPLCTLLGGLPAGFPAPIFVVVHLNPGAPSHLPDVLGRAGPLPAAYPLDGEVFLPGRVYVAPPDHHLLIEDHHVWVHKGPRENRFRPAIDTLFRSAAYTHREAVVGVVLSGMLDDGTSGLWTVGHLGGTTVVQHPGEAEFDAMPLSALRQVEVDHTLPAADIARLLVTLAGEAVPGSGVPDLDPLQSRRLEVEVAVASGLSGFDLGVLGLGELSPLTCPDCQGVMVQIEEGGLVRYRCHTGHAYTAATLLGELTEQVEEKSYQVMRALEEHALLLSRLARRYDEAADPNSARAFGEQARAAQRRTALLRDLIFQNPPPAEPPLQGRVGDD